MSDDDDFDALKRLRVPLPDAAARRRALGASLMAFDEAQKAETKKSAEAPQGSALWRRLISIVPNLKGSWIMDTRRLVPAGTAALALVVLLPLGYQLYSSTALTRPSPSRTAEMNLTAAPTPATAVDKDANRDAPAPVAPQEKTVVPVAKPVPAPAAPTAPQTADAAAQPKPADTLDQLTTDELSIAGKVGELGDAEISAASRPQTEQFRARVDGSSNAVAAFAAPEAAPMPAVAAPPRVAGIARLAAAAPSISPRVATSVTGDAFQKFTESAQKAVATDPVSTFSIDVDTASYSYVRRALNEGRIPEADAVRLEEMINYFPYDYPAASSASQPFKPTISVFPTPWNSHTELMQIGIRGYVPPASARRPSNLVFLIDTSGSMDEPDKLPLLQRALGLLVNTLNADDTVSIVTYAGSAGVVLEPTKGSDKVKILAALDNLQAGGSTAGAEGIELAYREAEQHKTDGNNRVILATDGDFNVGIDDPDDLKTFIKSKRQSGIGLSVLGFGEGNLDDATMQALAQNGDGNASYIDNLSEAQKVLVKEAGSTLDTIAKDVKIQVEFNPATVSSYRLIGYETRALNREDFNNDKVDAGDVGAGHTVTALYEITPVGSDATPAVDPLRYGSTPAAGSATAGKDAELADFKLRYKLPGSDTSQLIEQPVTPSMVVKDIGSASNDARWAAAVAAFGQKLKGSDYAGSLSYDAIQSLAAGARGADPDGYRSEFVHLVGLAGALSGSAAPAPADDGADMGPVVN